MNLDDVELHYVDSLDDALALKRWLGERPAGLRCFDTETAGLEYGIFAETRLVQFGDQRHGWAVPAQDWRGLVREIFRDYEGEWGAHNAKYDEHMVERLCGARPRRVHDTAIQSHLDDPLERRALKPAAGRLVDPRAAHLDSQLDGLMAQNGWTWETVPLRFPPYWTYGALDPVLTSAMDGALRPRLVERGQEELYELELAAQRVCKKMETRGLRVDVEYCHQQQDDLERQLDELRAWCERTYGFGIGSRKRVGAQLVRDGWEPPVYTKTGDPSLKKVFLQTAYPHPLARAYARKNLLQVRSRNFFGNLIKFGHTGMLHPSINPLEAKTGRMSIERPSLQNQPRSKLVRDAFLAREGHRLVTADFKQIEARLLAHFSRDPQLLSFFIEERDMPTEVARAVFAIDDALPVPADTRQKTKSAIYSLGFGAGPPRIAAVLGTSIAEGEAFLSRLFGLYPDFGRFLEVLPRVAIERDSRRPWVETPLRRRLQVRQANHAYKLVNWLIQAEAGIAFKRQLVALDQAGLGEWLVLPVHDEAISDVPEEHVDEARRIYAEVMPDTTTYRCPLAVDVGEPVVRWGSKYEGFVEEDELTLADLEELDEEED